MVKRQSKKKRTRKRSKRIRLGCLQCDRDDFDGVDRLPSGWEDIGRVQSYESSMKQCGFSDKFGESCFDWYTHLGLCPDCATSNKESICR